MTQRPDFQPVEGLPRWRQAHLHSVGSTNADLLEWARGSDLDRAWLTAGEQTAGRGRRGRVWVSPHGNLHASLLLRDPAPREHLSMLPLVAGLAVHDAIASLLGTGPAAVRLKWPNDVLIDGAKCCGILLENEWRRDGGTNVVIGCGINLIAHPEDTPYPATALDLHAPGITTETAFRALASAFDTVIAQWGEGRRNRVIRDRWLAVARGLGDPLRVNLPTETLEGRFDGIDENGQLLLTLANGASRTISAGDVFFAPSGAPPTGNT